MQRYLFTKIHLCHLMESWVIPFYL